MKKIRIIILVVGVSLLYSCSKSVCNTYYKHKPVKASKNQGKCYF